MKELPNYEKKKKSNKKLFVWISFILLGAVMVGAVYLVFSGGFTKVLHFVYDQDTDAVSIVMSGDGVDGLINCHEGTCKTDFVTLTNQDTENPHTCTISSTYPSNLEVSYNGLFDNGTTDKITLGLGGTAEAVRSFEVLYNAPTKPSGDISVRTNVVC